MSDILTDNRAGLGKKKVRNYDLKDAYRIVSWVYACITRISDSISSVPLKFYTEDVEGEQFDLDKQHPLIELFNPPKKFQITSLRELLKITLIYLELFGEAFWKLDLKRGMPVEVDLMSPFKLTPLFHKKDKELLVGWGELEYGTVKNTYTLGQIVQFKYPNPYNKWRGLSPLSSARLPIEQDLSMSFWNAEFFRKGLRSPLAIILERVLNKSQREEFRAELEKSYQGFKNGQSPLLVEGGADVKTLLSTMKDLDFIQGKQLTREEVCAVFAVPPALVGIYRYANYANSEQQEKIFWKNTLSPKMNYLVEVAQTHILDIHYPDVLIDWDWDKIDVLKEDRQEKAETNKVIAETVRAYYDMGFSIEEIAEIIDEPVLASSITEAEGDELPPSTLPASFPRLISVESAYDIDIKSNGSDIIKYGISKDTLLHINDDYQENIINPYTERWKRFIMGFLENASRTIMRRIDKGDMSPYLSDLRWTGTWLDFSYPIVESIYSDGVRQAVREVESPRKSLVGSAYKIQGDIADLYNSDQILSMNQAIDAINKKTVGLPQNMISQLNSVTRKGLMAGATSHQIRSALIDKVGEIFQSDALTVARTVTGSAYNSAKYTGSRLKGGHSHTWSSARDTNVRDTHGMEHGHEVEMGKPFPVTRLLYPLDPQGRAEEIINCRCSAFVSAVRRRGDIMPIGVLPVASPEPIMTPGASLSDFEGSIKDNNHETLGAFDSNGKSLFAKTGERHKIDLTNAEVEKLTGKELLLTHNHPSSRSFSNADISFVHTTGAREIRAVTREGTVFRLLPPKGQGTFAILNEDQQWELFNDIEDAINEVDDYLVSQIGRGAIDVQTANKTRNHLFITKLAKKRKYRYKVEN